MNTNQLFEESTSLFGSGCARKFPLRELEQNHLAKLKLTHPDVFLGTFDFDDVGACSMGGNKLLVQSVDVIASLPVSPYDFGTICATHCLSDIYAKGVEPLTALNILFHSVSPYDPVQIDNIFSGMMDKLQEANTAFLGGHTINEKSLYCGLVITGTIKKGKIILTKGAKIDDDIILTKPLGTGIISLAVRNGILESFPRAVIASMSTLNSFLTKFASTNSIHSCTDVTGAGLAGSLYNMAVKSSVEIEIFAEQIPYYHEAFIFSLNEEDGALFNRDYTRGVVIFNKNTTQEDQNLFFDPQTSGGLLLAVSPENTDQILNEIFLHNSSIEPKVIGKVTSPSGPVIRIS